MRRLIYVVAALLVVRAVRSVYLGVRDATDQRLDGDDVILNDDDDDHDDDHDDDDHDDDDDDDREPNLSHGYVPGLPVS